MSSQVGSGHIAIFPVMTGMKAKISSEMQSAGKAGSGKFTSSLKGVGASTGSKLGSELKRAFSGSSSDIATATLSTLKKNVASASSTLSNARLKQQDEAGKVRVAEIKLQEAIDKYGESSSQAVAAEERLESARRKEQAATEKVADASDKLKSAQDDLKSATESASGEAETASSKWDKLASASSNAASKLESAGSKISSVGSTLTTAITTPVLKAVAAVTAVGSLISKSAISAYADWEQNVGGVDTLFKGASGTIQKYADKAYKSAGISANSYMETVTSFSASLISSLGGNTAEAAELANQAVTDMSDNANKMGTDMSTIQSTYQSLARGNYAMLDNLKLGYGGTKTELERLLSDAQKLSGVEYSSDSFSDIISAIHVVQDEMGITGTTAQEAADTISGSVSSMKAEWTNWLTELGKTDGDVAGVTSELMASIGTVIENVGPRVVQVFKSLWASLPSIVDGVLDLLPAKFQGVADLILKGDFTSSLREAFNIDEDSPIVSAILRIREVVVDLVGTYGEVAAWGGVFLVALGPVLSIVGKVVSMGGTLLGWVSRIASAIGGLTSSFGGLTGGTGGVLKMFTRFLGPIGLVISALVALWTQSETFRGAVKSLASTIGSVIGSIVAALQPLVASIMSTLSPLIATIGDMVGQMLAKLTPIVSQAGALFAGLIQTITPFIQWVVAQLVPVFEIILSTVQRVFGAILPIIQAAMGLIQSIITTVMAVIHGDWSGAWQGIQNIVSSAWALIKSIISGAIEAVKAVISGALAIISSLWSSAWNGIKTVFSSIWSGIKGAASAGVDAVVTTVRGVKDKIVSVFSGAGSWLVDAGKNLLAGLATGIGNAIGSVVSKAKEAAGEVVDSVKGFFGIHSPSRVFRDQIGKQLPAGAAIGIEQGTDGLVSSAVAMARKTTAKAQAAVGTVTSSIRADVKRSSASPSGQSVTPSIYVQNPFTGEYLLAQMDERATNVAIDVVNVR